MTGIDERQPVAGLLDTADRPRRRRRSGVLVGVAVGVSAAVVMGAVVLAASPDRPDGRGAGVSASGVVPEPAPLARLGEGDLQAMTRAAGDLGRGEYARVFTNLRTDDCRCSVTVYLTDLGERDAFLAAMRARDPRIDDAHVLFAQGARTRAACVDLATATFNELFSPGLPFKVFQLSPTIDCAAIQVGVNDVQAAQAYFDDPGNGLRRNGVVLTAVPGAPLESY